MATRKIKVRPWAIDVDKGQFVLQGPTETNRITLHFGKGINPRTAFPGREGDNKIYTVEVEDVGLKTYIRKVVKKE